MIQSGNPVPPIYLSAGTKWHNISPLYPQDIGPPNTPLSYLPPQSPSLLRWYQLAAVLIFDH